MPRTALERVVVGQPPPQRPKTSASCAIISGKGRNREDIFSIDEAFHIRMAEIAGLHQIKRVLLSVRGKMYLIASGVQVTELRNDKVVREHNAIVDAIEKHDGKSALAAIADHIERSIDAFAAARKRVTTT